MEHKISLASKSRKGGLWEASHRGMYAPETNDTGKENDHVNASWFSMAISNRKVFVSG